LLKDIATPLNYSPRGLKLTLDTYSVQAGETMSGGRLRRGNASSGGLANGKMQASDSQTV